MMFELHADETTSSTSQEEAVAPEGPSLFDQLDEESKNQVPDP